MLLWSESFESEKIDVFAYREGYPFGRTADILHQDSNGSSFLKKF